MSAPTRGRDLDGLTALVTGATSGLGRGIAVHLASRGATTLVHGRDSHRGAAVVADIVAAGGAARFLRADLTNDAELRSLVQDAGKVDILVNNAGFSWFGPSAEMDLATFDRIFASNVRAPYFLTTALAPAMAERGSGAVINISSMVGTVGLPAAAAYGATKLSLDAFTRAWTAEFSGRGVRFNSVAPGPVYTEGALTERTTAIGETTPLRRAAHVDEIAEVVGFLASPAASYVTGAIVAADGGRTAV